VFPPVKMGNFLSKFRSSSPKPKASTAIMATKSNQPSSSATSAPPNDASTHPSIFVPESFRIRSVDNTLRGCPVHKSNGQHVPQQPLGVPRAVVPHPEIDNLPEVKNPPLGVLENFKGDFTGTGFNLIFRPNNGTRFNTAFDNVDNIPVPPNEQVLELNLTTERMSFATPLGSVPNRGLTDQADIFLNGVPYLQTISDVTNTETGLGDGPPQPIHFEPGLWMHVPATTVDPIQGESLVRMASIPHGTTINAQSIVKDESTGSPVKITKDRPTFDKADPTPILIKTGVKLSPFPAQTFENVKAPRLPQDLGRFNEPGTKTITPEILANPNLILENAIKGQKIIETKEFTVTTMKPGLVNEQVVRPQPRDGIANIAFLEGTAPDEVDTNANANAVSMVSTFYIETVEWELKVPRLEPNQEPLTLKPDPPHPGAKVPSFIVKAGNQVLEETTITLHTTQIQYTQTVILNFARLAWPHISVATLTPADPLDVPNHVFTAQK
jgi:hypothetical protein